MPESLSVSRQITCLGKEILFLLRYLAFHLKMHCYNTETIDSAHTNGYFLDTRSKKRLRKEDLQFSSQPRHPIRLLMQVSDAVSWEAKDTYLATGRVGGEKDLQTRDCWPGRAKRIRSYSLDYKGAIHYSNQFALRYLQKHAKAVMWFCLTYLVFVICLTFALHKSELHRGNFDATPCF